MDMGKGKEAVKKDWKDQLAELDKECGWDAAANLNWYEEVDKDEDQGRSPCVEQDRQLEEKSETPLNVVATRHEVLFLENDDNESAIVDDDDEEDEEHYSAVETMDDEPIVPSVLSSQRRDYELHPNVIYYVRHRFGPSLRYEDRCYCHEWLVDWNDQRKETERVYYARAGTCLQKSGCVLRNYPPDDVPGTEDVDKPVLTVTRSDGKTFWPHLDQVFPEWVASPPSELPTRKTRH